MSSWLAPLPDFGCGGRWTLDGGRRHDRWRLRDLRVDVQVRALLERLDAVPRVGGRAPALVIVPHELLVLLVREHVTRTGLLGRRDFRVRNDALVRSLEVER